MEGEDAVFVAPSSLLVASPNPQIAARIASRLRAEGYECVQTSSARAAIDLLVSSTIDTLIIDVALLRDCPRKNEASPPWTNLGVPVLALAGDPTQAALLDAFEAKVSGVLLDPLEGDSLFKQVRACLEYRRTFLTIEAAGTRFGGYVEALENLKGLISSWPGSSSLRARGFFIQMTIANIAAELADMTQLIDRQPDTRNPDDRPPAPSTPDDRRHVAILKEVVAVLEETRSSFKSKKLAALRRRLEEEILQR